MNAMYQIVPERERNLIRVTMAGFFSKEEVAAFGKDYREALAELLSPGHLTLVDIREMKIQSQEVVAAFSSHMASPGIQSHKLAFVCSSSLARLQAQRLTDRENVEFFDLLDEAEQWLLATTVRPHL